MTRGFFFLLIVAIIAMYSHETSAQGDDKPGAAGDARRCHRPNEVWNNCGSACAPTCERPRPTGACIKLCRVGCECRQGFFKRRDGACVRYSECNIFVPPGERNE